MVTLLLVRHGFSVGNKTNTFTGHLDIPLCDLGIKQAELVSDYILKNYKVDGIYSSPMSRAVDTVKKISDKLNLPINLNKDLIEIHGGDWEGMNFKDMEEKYPEEFKSWTDNKGLVRCPNGESMKDAGDRAYKALVEICNSNPDKTLVIASHGGVLRTLRCYFSGLGIESFNDVPWAPNASISIVQFENGKFLPKGFGITEHLNDLTTNLPNL